MIRGRRSNVCETHWNKDKHADYLNALSKLTSAGLPKVVLHCQSSYEAEALLIPAQTPGFDTHQSFT